MIAHVVLLLLGAPSLIETSTCSPAEIDAIVEGRRELPALTAVQDAVRVGWSAHASDPSWPGRARWRGLAPRLDVSVGSDADLDVRDSTDARTTVEGRALGLRVSARFDLGDLVFADSELRASRESAARQEELRALLVDVTKLYFRRVELLLALREGVTAALLLEAKTVDGLIAALTGGQLR